MQVRYAALLRAGLLQATGIKDFNTGAATFGQVVEEMELSVAGGDGFKLKSRFARFRNVPELLNCSTPSKPPKT